MNATTRTARGFTLIELLACRPKPWRRQARKGFTLIELLVVITIIGLLAAILIPAITGALKSAKRTRALSQIRDLDGAVKRYFTEYGKMPVPAGDNGGPDKLYTGATQARVIEILINKSLDANANPKEIVFLDLDPASFGVKTVDEMLAMLTRDLPYNDPWGDPEVDDGHEYGILMDLNFDEKITVTGYGNNDEIRAKVAVYSLGEPEKAYEIDTTPYKTW